MKRHLFTLISLLSLLLCIGTMALWIRSQMAVDSVYLCFTWRSGNLTSNPIQRRESDPHHWKSPPMQGSSISITSNDSHLELRLDYYSLTNDLEGPPSIAGQSRPWVGWYDLPADDLTLLPISQAQWKKCGFYFLDDVVFPHNTEFGSDENFASKRPLYLVRHYGSPDWFILIATAILPIIWFRNFMRRRRYARIGHCTQCGYDLRATPDRCPECGATPEVVFGSESSRHSIACSPPSSSGKQGKIACNEEETQT